MKKVLVISLGGSLIVPDKIDYKFLERFHRVIKKKYSKHKFIVVCGGGSIARRYIDALKKENKSKKEISLAGIRATRLNALFMMQFFGKQANSAVPSSMVEAKNQLEKNNIVFCGALRYAADETSDGTAAKLARHYKTSFINLTNVAGLYTNDPRKDKNAKLIEKISWKEFEKLAHKIKYKPGQHFVLDQNASTIIRKSKIATYILGRDMKNLSNLLENKKFTGTSIND